MVLSSGAWAEIIGVVWKYGHWPLLLGATNIKPLEVSLLQLRGKWPHARTNMRYLPT